MMREAYVAGEFYPQSLKALTKQIESMVDKKTKRDNAIAIISPHAGYAYSGNVAAAVFSSIEITDTVIMLGPNHTGIGPVFSLYANGSWRTPMGDIAIDEKIASVISKKCGLITEDEKAHSCEHSLEVQLPFMQYFKKGLKIVPMIAAESDFSAYKAVAEAIAAAIDESNKDILIVASSDMTHYEPREDAQRKDKIAIDAILNLDEELLLKKIKEFNITMCGYVPSVIMLIAAKLLGAKSARLIKYQTSGDTSGDYSTVVGYAGIIIK